MSKLFKVFYLILIITMVSTMVGCVKYREKMEMHKELYVRQEQNLTINNDFANIKIEQYDGPVAKLVFTKEVMGKKREKQREVFNNLSVDIRKENEEVIIYTSGSESIDSSIISADVTCVVQLPKKLTNLTIKNTNGDMDITGDFRNIKGEVKEGNIEINGAIKEYNIVNSKGKIILNDENIS